MRVKPKAFKGLFSNKPPGRSTYQAQACYQPYNQNHQRGFGPRRTFSKITPKVEVNEQYFKQPARKWLYFCSNNHLYTRTTCCKLFNEQQSFSMYSQSPTQFRLAMGPELSCTQHSSRTQQFNRLPMHGANKLNTNNIRPLGSRGIQGYKIEFWKQPTQAWQSTPSYFS